MDPLPFRLHVPRLNYRDFAIAIRFQRNGVGNAAPFLTGCNYMPWMKMSFDSSGSLSVNVGRQGIRQVATIKSGKWYDLVCSVNRKVGKANVYLNGEKIQTIPIPTDEYFGQERSMANHSGKHFHFWDRESRSTFDGLIDELIVFDKALDDQQAADLRMGAVQASKPLPQAHKP